MSVPQYVARQDKQETDIPKILSDQTAGRRRRRRPCHEVQVFKTGLLEVVFECLFNDDERNLSAKSSAAGVGYPTGVWTF
jgi:hypothetical protein